MSKHTPGPWYVPEFDKSRIDNNYRIVAHVTPSSAYRHENEPNARLIAAAPEVLEALKEARVYVEQAYECAFPDEGKNANLLAEIDALIAKAEGK